MSFFFAQQQQRRQSEDDDEDEDENDFLHQMKSRMELALMLVKRPRLGKTVLRFAWSTPNQSASLARYWSVAVVGIQRPVLVSSGP